MAAGEPAGVDLGSAPRPAALAYGPGHVIVHINPAFMAEFGAGCLGLPASEVLVSWPAAAFELLDLAYREGRAVAMRVVVDGTVRRLVAVPRRDIETGEVYGLGVHLVAAAAELTTPR